jgi:RES domain-containing protein
MLVYRITKSAHASDISGKGAALYPGRWNKKGTSVLYTSETPEIALLETIVHIPAMMTPELDILTIEIPENDFTLLGKEDLPTNWFHFPAPTILTEIGQQWVDGSETLALRVPSSIIQTGHNFIINCNHRDFIKVKVIERKRFYLDTRLTNR